MLNTAGTPVALIAIPITSTSEGITSTTESVDESISGLEFYVNVVPKKGLVPPGWQIQSNVNVLVYGLQAVQADSLEELRGFL